MHATITPSHRPIHPGSTMSPDLPTKTNYHQFITIIINQSIISTACNSINNIIITQLFERQNENGEMNSQKKIKNIGVNSIVKCNFLGNFGRYEQKLHTKDTSQELLKNMKFKFLKSAKTKLT
jgi:hypothetical protein